MTKLTPTQQRVFDLLVQGDTNVQIGYKLGITEKTVKAHVTAILKISKCSSRCRLIVNYYQEKLQHENSPSAT